MSRDFLIHCKDAASAKRTEERLLSRRAPDGEPTFEVDNRGDSLFATLSYPHEIKPSDPLSQEVVFVAIKNGRHNGIGYFIDTDQSAAPSAEPIPLTELWSRMATAF
jgi:hypothetical protein